MLLLTVACDGLLEATRVIAPSSALIYVTHGLRLSIAHPCPCTPVKAVAAAARDSAAKTRDGERAIIPRKVRFVKFKARCARATASLHNSRYS